MYRYKTIKKIHKKRLRGHVLTPPSEIDLGAVLWFRPPVSSMPVSAGNALTPL